MQHDFDYLIVGGGMTADAAAKAIHEADAEARIGMVSDESHAPYERPPLSKEYLVDGDDEDLYLLPEQWCADKDVELLLGTPVTGLDVAGRSVTLADGRTIGADAIVLATGGRARRLPDVEGDRILYLRTLDDAGRLDQLLQPGARLVVVGGGFIGSEVAAAGRARGAEVTLVEMLEQPLARVLGTQLGAVCAQVIVRCGFNDATMWADPVASAAMAWLTFVAMAAAVRSDGNMYVRFSWNWLSDRGRRVAEAVSLVLAIVFAIALSFSAWELMEVTKSASVEGVPIDVSWATMYSIILLSGAFIVIFTLERFFNLIRGAGQ